MIILKITKKLKDKPAKLPTLRVNPEKSMLTANQLKNIT